MVDGFLRKVQDALIGDTTDGESGSESEEQYGNVRPASEDPYGDPADQEDYANARPASEDPYGDPADQEYS